MAVAGTQSVHFVYRGWFLTPLSHCVAFIPLPVCVGSLCRVVFLGARPLGPSWHLLPPGSKAAPAAPHRTA